MMNAKRITLIDGHPDPDPGRFVHALAGAYAEGAAAGHEVRRITVHELDFPLISSRRDWESDYRSTEIRQAQEAILWAEHVAIFYPLWLGDMPALLKGFFEQVMRPGFAFRYGKGPMPAKGLKGRSAHIVVTMGMPALFFRLYYGASSLKALERNILRFVGFAPIRHSLIGKVEARGTDHARWLAEMRAFGEAAG